MIVHRPADSEYRAALTHPEALDELGLRLGAYDQAAADPTIDRSTLAVVELEVDRARHRLTITAANRHEVEKVEGVFSASPSPSRIYTDGKSETREVFQGPPGESNSAA